jgi:mono/diheme cytochrome c family protein
MRSIALALTIMAVGSSSHAADYVSMPGKDLYKRFCAACHGVDAAGNGPVADSLTVEVPDLRLLARRAGGSFPRERVMQIIDGRHIIGAHGSRVMPVWGEDLSRIAVGDPDAERATQLGISRITDYLSQLQRPVPE